MPPWNSTTPPMDISLISLVEVPFAYGKPLRQNMSWAKKLSKHEWRKALFI